MKKVLITGANSYIGTSVEKYLTENYPSDITFDTIDMTNDDWRIHSFHGYDCVFHVAGIAHSDSGKTSLKKEFLYRQVNTDLTIETALKAKTEGVKQFIFMSSAIVYGNGGKIGKTNCVTIDTTVSPSNCYGDSKVQAEKGILALQDEYFKVCVLRPPMIYGKGCKGNYVTLSKFAKKLPFFPYVKNERSMLYIDNLAEFIRLMILNEESGVFFPQNDEYTNTSEMVKLIALAHGKKMPLIKGFTWAIKLLGLFTKLASKAFGNFTYARELSEYKEPYAKFDLQTSIELTEKSDM